MPPGLCWLKVLYRVLASGFYSSAIQSFRYARPFWGAWVVSLALVPAFSETLEFLSAQDARHATARDHYSCVSNFYRNLEPDRTVCNAPRYSDSGKYKRILGSGSKKDLQDFGQRCVAPAFGFVDSQEAIVCAMQQTWGQFPSPGFSRQASDLFPGCITAELPARNRVFQCKKPPQSSFLEMVYYLTEFS